MIYTWLRNFVPRVPWNLLALGCIVLPPPCKSVQPSQIPSIKVGVSRISRVELDQGEEGFHLHNGIGTEGYMNVYKSNGWSGDTCEYPKCFSTQFLFLHSWPQVVTARFPQSYHWPSQVWRSLHQHSAPNSSY